MKPEFTVAWALWFTVAVLAEIVGAARGQWMALLGALCALELLAVLRRAPGDTGSEHVWWWTGDRPGRAAMAGLLGAWVAYRIYSVTPGGAGPALLCLALAAWLVPHWATRGKTG